MEQNEVIINQAISLFKDREKWSAFLELYHLKDKIRDVWFSQLDDRITQYFRKEGIVSGWDFKRINGNEVEYIWYLSDFGEQSIYLSWFHKMDLILAFDSEHYEKSIIDALISKEKKYATIYKSGFRNPVFDGLQKNDLVAEKGYLFFDSPMDGHFKDVEDLAWYAGNMTISYLQQITEKVDLFRKNKSIMTILADLNKQARK